MLHRLKGLYLLVDPPVDPNAVKDPRKESDPELSLAHDALAPLVQQKYRESSAPAQMARKVLDSLTADSGSDHSSVTLNEAQLKLIDAGLPWTKRPDTRELQLVDSSRKSVKKQKDHEQSLARWRDRLAVAAGIGLLIASVAAWGFWGQRDKARQSSRELGEQVTKTENANKDLTKAKEFAETEKKKQNARRGLPSCGCSTRPLPKSHPWPGPIR